MVTFAHYRRAQTMRYAPRGGWRYALGEPDWLPLAVDEFAALLGRYAG